MGWFEAAGSEVEGTLHPAFESGQSRSKYGAKRPKA